jgi:long-chain acyl-CoA synthetase
MNNMFNLNSILIAENGQKFLLKNRIEESDLFINSFLKKRELIFFLCNNTIDSISLYVSFINNGIVPILINSDLEESLITDIIEKYNPSYIFIPFTNQNYDLKYAKFLTYNSFSVLKARNSFETELDSELAILLSSSGSTGSPKLIRISYKNLLSNATSISNYLNLNSDEIAITNLPMNYSYGLSIINCHLYVGAKIVVTEKSIIQRDFWNLVKINNVTSLSGVPYTYEILKKLKFFKMDLPSIKYMTQAGGKLSNNIIEEFANHSRNKKIDFFVMYGQTEGTARLSFLYPNKILDKLGSIGKAIPGGKFKLVNSKNKTIELSNIEGELVYVGENVMMGYANEIHHLSNGSELNNTLYTGDLAYKDEEGYFFITGRKKRFIKIYGNRFSLDEIENYVKKNEIECACTGFDDKLKVFITNINNEQKVINILKKLKIQKSAYKILTIEILPKNNSGKVLYSKLNSNE